MLGRGREIVKLVISGTVPSLKNSKQIFRTASGRPFITSSDKAKEWTATAVTELREQFKGYSITEYPVEVTLVMYNKDRVRRDLDNQASGVLDAMRHAGVLADDDYKHIHCLIVQFGSIDKENPRCEVFLEG